MASLGSHINVWESCLQLLHRRGWKLRLLVGQGDDRVEFEATLGDIDLLADNPIELLGLAAIHDELRPVEHRPYWWVIDPEPGAPRLYDQLFAEAEAEQKAQVEHLRELRTNRPRRWLRHIELALDNSSSVREAASEMGVPEEEFRAWLEDPLVAPLVAKYGLT